MLPITIDQLPERMRESALSAGWNTLMPVQSRAIPYLLAGQNSIIQARTGSGKTGAFMLPLLERLDPSIPACQTLILVPTRELARQVFTEAERLCGKAGLRTAAVYGGVAYGPQLEALRSGAHIVVGTPGRILDLLFKRSLNLDQLRAMVYDEADQLLSMGFYPEMRDLQKFLPRGVLTSMFSATFPAAVMRTAREFIREPKFITLSSDHVHVTDTEHIFYVVPGMDKDRALMRLIEIENPGSSIIFCNTKDRVRYVALVLQRFGYDADDLSADLTQKQRDRVLERVRGGTLRFLVATDVAARGLDIKELSHVILYETPEDPEGYIHRAGRTGRAGAPGIAISLVDSGEAFRLAQIAKQYGIEMQERPVPTDADVEGVVSQRLIALLEARLRTRGTLQTERSRRFIALARELAENEDESAVIAMLLDEYYQQSLHAPVPQPGGGEAGREQPEQHYQQQQQQRFHHHPQPRSQQRRGGGDRRAGRQRGKR